MRENRAFSPSFGYLVGRSASSEPLVSFVPVTLVWGVSRRGNGPVKQCNRPATIHLCIWRAKTRVHQTARTGAGNLAHERCRAKRKAQRQAPRQRCTIRAHPASSPRRPHLWMLVWRTSRPEGHELVTEAQQLWNDCSDSLRSQVSEATWRAWFSAIRPVAVANGTLVLAVPSGVVRDRLEGRFHGLVHDALLDSSGKEVQFRFDVQIDDPYPKSSSRIGTIAVRAITKPQSSTPSPATTSPRWAAQGRPKAADDVPLEPEVHLRNLRHRPFEPFCPRRRPLGGRSAGTFVQPVVRLRRCRAWERPTSCRRSATTCGRISRACGFATSRPRPS